MNWREQHFALLKAWDESAHPRAPAGDAHGGQWTSGSSGGGSAKREKGSRRSHLSQAVAQQVHTAATPAEKGEIEQKVKEATAEREKRLKRSQEILAAFAPRIDNEKPRPLGEVGQKNFDRLSSAINQSSHLNENERKEYDNGIRKVMGRIPETAHERISQNMKDVQFFSSPEALVEGLWQTEGKPKDEEAKPPSEPKLGWFTRLSLWLFTQKDEPEGQRVDPEELHRQFVAENAAAGIYSRFTSNLYLDGGSPTPSGMGRKADSLTAAMVQAHELGHAIDGPRNELSRSEEWASAFESEIDKEGDPLTAYARTKPSEGFAEFCRLLYGGGVDLDEVEKAFPRCSAFAKEKQLWPG